MNFCRNVLGVTLMVTTHTKITAWNSAGGYFGVFLGSFWCMFQYFLRIVHYFLMKFYADVLDILWWSLHYFSFHVMYPWGPFWYMFLYFLRIIQYFLMKFSIDVCSTTLMVTALKIFIQIVYFSAGGHFGVFLERLL